MGRRTKTKKDEAKKKSKRPREEGRGKREPRVREEREEFRPKEAKPEEEFKIQKEKKTADLLDNLKLYGKWTYDINLKDPGLVRYLNLRPLIIPRTSGIYEAKKFWKSKMNIVERLMNKLMVPGHKRKKHWWTSKVCTGKSHKVYVIVEKAFNLINKKTNLNPIEVLARAVETSSPREEITSIESGGVRHPKSVDVSPQRRVDLSLRWITQGAYMKTVNKKTGIVNTLAEELILASKSDNKSYAMSRKIEIERQAAASR